MKTIYDSRYRRLVGRLKARRLALGLDQSAVTAKLGHTNRWVSKVEHLDLRLDVMAFIRVCRALGVRASELIRETEEAEEESDSSSYLPESGIEWLGPTAGWHGLPA